MRIPNPSTMRNQLLALAALSLAACGSPVQEQASAVVGAAPDVVFTDVTTAAGIQFKHHHGRSGKKYLPETLGAGVAFFDYNNDGWSDLFFTNGRPWDTASNLKTPPALYRNNKDGTFTDVTQQAGLAIDIYGMGIAAADYDKALAAHPDAVVLQFNRAIALTISKQYLQAVSAFESILRANADEDAAREGLGTVRMMMGDLPGAISQYEHLLRKNPTAAKVALRLGFLYAEAGRASDAARTLQVAVQHGTEAQRQQARDALAQLGAPP